MADITKITNKLVKEAELAKIASQPNGLQVIANLMMKPLVRDLLHESRVRGLLREVSSLS